MGDKGAVLDVENSGSGPRPDRTKRDGRSSGKERGEIKARQIWWEECAS